MVSTAQMICLISSNWTPTPCPTPSRRSCASPAVETGPHNSAICSRVAVPQYSFRLKNRLPHTTNPVIVKQQIAGSVAVETHTLGSALLDPFKILPNAVWVQSCLLTEGTGVPDLGRLSHRCAGHDRDPIVEILDSPTDAGPAKCRNNKRA